MSRSVDLSNHSRKHEHSALIMQEVSDTETIDHEHFGQDAEVSDVETVEHKPFNLTEPRTAWQDVLGTTELPEHIISFLPMRKIFEVQHVAKQWRDVIDTSPSIEEKMFLRLKATPKETCDPRLMGWPYRALQRLGRPVPSALTLVNLNPELRHDEIPEVLNCVLVELELTLLDDIAAPTPQERAELHQGSNPRR